MKIFRVKRPCCMGRGISLLAIICFGVFGAILSLESNAVADNTVPRPEYPRPDAYRENWLNLNGAWQFEIDKKGDGDTRGLITGTNLRSKITVPYPPESKDSGLNLGNTERFKTVWYRRLFKLPEAMNGHRVLLNFGAVYYQAWAYVNGKLVGTHLGGSASFSFDVTTALRPGENEIVVKVFDDISNGAQPKGKQSDRQNQGWSGGITYTRSTGIWQTVWLEAVGGTYIKNISCVPDPDHSRVLISAEIDGPQQGLTLSAQALAEGKLVGSESSDGAGKNVTLVLNLSEKHLWEPDSPFLYDLKFTLTDGKKPVDALQSYFGLRKITVQGRRILINGKPIFMRTILDQGFYPDGSWTAPTDNDLKHDIELAQAAGFNGARLHQKVFDPRYLYWADKLGYLVWGEFPNWGYDNLPHGYAPYTNEWIEVLLRDRNHPSIIGWTPFNENDNSPSAAEIQQLVWNVTRAVDSTRPVSETSGWHFNIRNAELRDMHDYEGNPDTLRAKWMNFFHPTLVLPSRYGGGSGDASEPGVEGPVPGSRASDLGTPFWISEMGGIGFPPAVSGGYGAGTKSVDDFYSRYQGTVDALLDNPNLFGFCYTQLTDVEDEKNGLYYYDRRPKFDLHKLRAITSRQAAYEKGDPQAPLPSAPQQIAWKVIVPSALDPGSRPWRYMTKPVQGNDWTKPLFDDSGWLSAQAPFGNGYTGAKTPWTSSDITLRQTFQYQGDALTAAAIVIAHDDDAEVYLNGQRILSVSGYGKFSTAAPQYEIYPVLDAVLKSLKSGTNTLAIHTHQFAGGQFIDLALLFH